MEASIPAAWRPHFREQGCELLNEHGCEKMASRRTCTMRAGTGVLVELRGTSHETTPASPAHGVQPSRRPAVG